jgi:hypothetical protein
LHFKQRNRSRNDQARVSFVTPFRTLVRRKLCDPAAAAFNVDALAPISGHLVSTRMVAGLLALVAQLVAGMLIQR